MMDVSSGVLLDTCAVIWLMNGMLREEVLEQVIAGGVADGIYISPVSGWEIGMLARPRSGRPDGPKFLPDPASWFSALMARPGIKPAAFSFHIGIDASFLPGELHSDPADRLLIATARRMQIPFVTGDRKIIEYGAKGHLDVIAC